MNWFSDGERPIATTILSYCIPLGNLFSFLITGIISANLDEESSHDVIEAVQQIVTVQNIIITSVAIPFLLIVTDKPANPPSEKSQMKKDDSVSLKDQLSELFKNKNYKLLLIIFTILFGLMSVFGVIIGSIFSPYGLTGAQISVTAMVFLFSGLVGMLVIN